MNNYKQYGSRLTGQPWKIIINKADLWLFLGPIFLAMAIRLIAARDAYPAPTDAGHFVGHGMAIANHLPNAWSAYWSQAMQAIAACAVTAGLDPGRSLQAFSIVAGVVVVACVQGMALILFRSHSAALAGGLLAAVAPGMVQYSVAGYSDMGFCALTLAATVCLLWAPQARRPWLFCVAAGLLMGAAAWFKALDASVMVVAMAMVCFIGEKPVQNLRRNTASLLAVLLAYSVGLVPLVNFTKSVSGHADLGTKISNLTVGDDWKDS